MSPRWPVALVSLLVGIALGAAGFWFAQRDSAQSTDVEPTQVQTALVAADQRDLRRFDEWAGTLQPGPASTISASTRGTLTTTVDEGALIVAGDVVAEIDGTPVVALYGSVPQFRELNIDSEPGADVRQLEENLVALGFDPDGAVTVDDSFTAATEALVEAWETELGLAEPDGEVAAGQVAFIAGPSEATSRTSVGSQVNAGQQLIAAVTLAESGFVVVPNEESLDSFSFDLSVGEPVEGDGIASGAIVAETLIEDASLTTEGQPVYRWEADLGSIQLAVDVDEASTFDVGRELEIELPDGQLIDASVTDQSDVARAVQEGGNTVTVIDVTIKPVEPIESSISAGPVTVRVETDRIEGAVLVPASALIALAEGGHAVEIDGRGLIGVEIGAFDDGWVEITDGTVTAGEMVVVPT